MALQEQLNPTFLVLNNFYDIICGPGKFTSPQQDKYAVYK